MSRFAELALSLLGGSARAEAGFIAGLKAWYGVDTRVFLYSRGRVALHAVARTLNLQPGDEVVLSGYTCFVVPEALRPFGVKPVFVDIDPATYNTPADALLASMTSRTRLVLVQHTYGIPAGATAVAAACNVRDITSVEDACHALGTTVDGIPAGRVCRAGFLSGQWNKPFSTGLGGILLVSDPALARLVEQDRPAAARPRGAEVWELRLLMLAHAAFVGPRSYPLAQAAYRSLAARGILTGSSSPEEFAGQLPADYYKLMSPAQAQAGNAEAGRFHENVRARLELQTRYGERLRQLGLDPAPTPPGTVLSRYPVRVGNKEDLLRRAARSGVEIGSWFETPLHPLPLSSHEDVGYRPGSCPHSEEAARQVVNLPIRRTTTRAEAERCVRFLARHAKPA